MKVEPRAPRADSLGSRDAQAFVGMTLKSVRQAQKELVLTFEGSGDEDYEAHLICQPEGNLVTPPEGGQPVVMLTGMKYEIGTGPMTILSDYSELSGPAAEILGKRVMQARHDPRTHIFGLQFDAEYGLLITLAGLNVLYTKSLEVQFRKPLVTQ